MGTATEQLAVKFKMFEPTNRKRRLMRELVDTGGKIHDIHLHECRRQMDKDAAEEDKNTVTATDLHNSLYSDLRGRFEDYPAAMLQSVRNQALERHRSLKQTGGKCRFTGEINLLRVDGRTAWVEQSKNTTFRYIASLATSEGRIEVPLVVGQYQLQFLRNDRYEMKSGYLQPITKNGQTEWYLNMTYNIPYTVPAQEEFEHYVGVDLGLDPLATIVVQDAQGNIKEHHTLPHKWQEQLREKQEKLSRKQSRGEDTTQLWSEINGLIDTIVGCVSKWVALYAMRYENVCVVKEHLEGLRDKLYEHRSKELKKRFGLWPYRQILNAIEYKAHIAGCAWRTGSPAYTSQTCPSCQEHDNTVRDGVLLECEDCYLRMNCHRCAADNLASFKRRQILGLDEEGKVNPRSEQAREEWGFEALLADSAEPKGALPASDAAGGSLCTRSSRL